MNKSQMQSNNEPISFDIISISFFTKEPKLLLTKTFYPHNASSSSPSLSSQANLYLSLINNALLQKDYSNSASQSPFYINNEEISFTTFIVNQSKYHLLNITKSNIIIITKFPITTKSSIIKLYLYHTAVSFFNFIGSQLNFINTVNDSFNTKLFELYVFSAITKHFSLITKSLFKKSKLLLENIKYKTFFLVDLSSNDVIFSLHSIRRGQGLKRIKGIQLNDTLWNELMYHCNNLKVQYIKKYQNRFDSFEYQDYFVKMEYTSTYPRLTFIIKFLPVLKGIALIHIYSQNKLSRNEDVKAHYKEFDILYGNEMNKDSNGNIEYRYKEPKKLKEIEWFFIEFLLSCNSSFGFFFYPKFDLKYLDMSILKIIQDNIESTNEQISNDKVLNRITNALYEEYCSSEKQLVFGSCDNCNRDRDALLEDQLKAEEEMNMNKNKSSIKKNEMITNYQWNCISKNNEGLALYQISKGFILNELFNSINGELSPEDITLVFSKIDNQSKIEGNDQHISQLISNDFSVLTKQFTTGMGMRGSIEAMHLADDNEKSLFNVNITKIDHEGKGEIGKGGRHKQSKSDLVNIKKSQIVSVNKTAISKDNVVLHFLNKSGEHSKSNSNDSLGELNLDGNKALKKSKNKAKEGKGLRFSYKGK